MGVRGLRVLAAVVWLVVVLAPGPSTQQQWSEFTPKSEVEHVWNNKDFMFPDQLQRLKKQLSTRNRAVVPLTPHSVFIPSGCGSGEDYCEEVSDYPDQDTIKQIVRNSTSKVEAAILFDKPAREVQVEEKAAVPLTYSSRLRPGVVDTITTEEKTLRLPQDTGVVELQGKANIEYNFVEESPVCASLDSYVYPRSARTVDRKWRFIVNLNESDNEYTYAQAVKVEKCLRNGDSCDVGSYGGSKTVCRQKYGKRKLLALDDHGEQYIETFWFPSYCVCHKVASYEHDYSGLELLRTKERTVKFAEEEDRSFEEKVSEIESQIEVKEEEAADTSQEEELTEDTEVEIIPELVERNEKTEAKPPRLTHRRSSLLARLRRLMGR